MYNRNWNKRRLLEAARSELALCREQLACCAESMTVKNNLIAALEVQLHALQEEKGQQRSHEALGLLYRSKILTDQDWQEFKLHFDAVFPGYLNYLRRQFPELSPAEERQSLLIKLNIQNKECADILGISVEAVKKNRYRLKKRFHLEEQDSLDNFVNGLTF